MNKYQRRVNTLLNEIIQICDNQQIQWFLSGRSAMRCYQGELYKGGYFDMEITIPIEDVYKFMHACSLMKNRCVEGYADNPDFPGLYLKYIDTTTTLICMNEGLACRARGIFVKINLLRKVPTDPVQFEKAKKYENLIEDTAKTFVELTGETTWIERIWFRTKKVLIPKYHKRVFDYLIHVYSSAGSAETLIRTVDGKMHLFENARFVSLDRYYDKEQQVWIPEKPEEYFTKCYGSDWKAYCAARINEGKVGNTIYDSANYLVSLIIPYPFFVEELKKQGFNKRFFKKRQKKWETEQSESKIFEPANEAWNIANRAGDLWNIYEYYKDKKDELRILFDAGELFQLQEELKYYDEIVEKYADLDMGFMYDEQLWSIYLYVKKFMASKEAADRMNELAVKDEKLKIQLRDMRRELNESI